MPSSTSSDRSYSIRSIPLFSMFRASHSNFLSHYRCKAQCPINTMETPVERQALLKTQRPTLKLYHLVDSAVIDTAQSLSTLPGHKSLLLGPCGNTTLLGRLRSPLEPTNRIMFLLDPRVSPAQLCAYWAIIFIASTTSSAFRCWI